MQRARSCRGRTSKSTCGFSPLTMWISVNPVSSRWRERVLDELLGRERVGVLLLPRRGERAELALHAADVRLVQIQVLDEVDLVGAAAQPAREVGELAELEQVVRLEERDAVLEVEALAGLDLLPDRLQRRCGRERRSAPPLHDGVRQRLELLPAGRAVEARPRLRSVVEGELAGALERAASRRRGRARPRAARRRAPRARPRPRARRGAAAASACRRGGRCPAILPVSIVSPAQSRMSSAIWNAIPSSRPNSPLPPPSRHAASNSFPVLSAQRSRYASTVVSRVVALAALHRLAARERERRVGEHRDGARRRPSPRARRRRARRGSRRPPCAASAPCARPGRGAAATDARRRRSGRRGRASPCARARPRRRRRPAARAPAGAERKASIGRRRLPPAASALGADLGDEPRVARDRRVEPRLDARRGTSSSPGAARDRPRARLIVAAVAGVQRDDPAAEEPEAHAPRSRPRSSSAARSSGAGEAAHARRQVRVGLAARAARCPSSGTIRSNQSGRTAAATPRGCVISRIASRPPGRSTRAQLAQRRASRSATLRTPKPTVAASNVAVRERQREHVALHPLDRVRLAPRALEHPRREVEPGDDARPRRSAATARSPVPQQASSTRSPGRTTASTASRRQRRSSPAVITRFITS